MQDLSGSNVLVVDDAEINLEILAAALDKDYEVRVASDGKSALEIIKEKAPDLVLLDILMPGMDGYEVCRRLKKNSNTRDIPVVFITGMNQVQSKTRGFELGAVDYITKPFDIHEVRARVKTHLTNTLAKKILENRTINLEEKVKERTRELWLTQEVTIECMASLAETRDPETGGHIKRTKEYVRILAEQLKCHPKFSDFLNDESIDLICKSAPLHDIGKVGVPDSILMSHKKLTPHEWGEMKKHTIYGRDALLAAGAQLGENSFLRFAGEIAYSHHEKWDGTGYPEGLRGEEIPISGRLMALADVYDALISKRIYKQPVSHAKAVEIIESDKGKHFDPNVVEAFLNLEDKFRTIALQFIDFDEERVGLKNPIESQ
ncbi:MAG: two-component system response regulator [Deltaproteobacteria bacterium]|nr:MAG: two-component system response regulator [Deltaproteobacteria bacterium]